MPGPPTATRGTTTTSQRRRTTTRMTTTTTAACPGAGAARLAALWKKVGSEAGVLGTALHVAGGLRGAETAAMLLEPFRVETVAPEHAGGLAAAGQYGEEWTRGVIAGWFGPRHYLEADRYEWGDRLPGLCAARRAGGGPQVAGLRGAGAGGRGRH